MKSERLLVVAVATPLVEALRRAGREIGEAAVLTDATSRLQALLAAGREIPAHERADALPEVIEVRLPAWVMQQIDESVGARPGLGDRADVVTAALEAHLGEDFARPSRSLESGGDAAVLGYGTDAPSRPAEVVADVRRVLSAPSRGPLSPPDAATREERALRRLEGLVNGRGPTLLPALDLLPPSDLEHAEPLPASRVAVGIDEEHRGAVAEMGARRMDVRLPQEEPRDSGRWWDAHLSGLTNRVAPTLWAASRLAEAQARGDGSSVLYQDFISDLMPKAWRIGQGLEHEERLQGPSKFAVSARWPKLPRSRARRDQAGDEEHVRTQRLAQAVTSFIEYSLAFWRPPSRTGGSPVRGPMAMLGLADIWAEGDEVRIAVSPSAIPLLVRLGEVGTSCDYPHSDEAWREYSYFVSQHARGSESLDMLHLLRLLAQSESRADFYESAATFSMTEQQIDRKRGMSSKGYSTDANGGISRLREWGLVDMNPGAFGWSAITQRGRDALEGLGTFVPPSDEPPLS